MSSCPCPYAHTYAHTRIHTCIHTRIHTRTYTTCTHIFAYTPRIRTPFLCTHAQTNAHTQARTLTHTHTHTHGHTRARTRAHLLAHTTQTTQRPAPKRAADIGTWMVILDIIATCSILTNCALVGFTSHGVKNVKLVVNFMQ